MKNLISKILSLIVLTIPILANSQLHAQEIKEAEIEIYFKPKSTKLSRAEKEKIRTFAASLKSDSNFVYQIELIHEGCHKKKYLSWARVNAIIRTINSKRGFNSSIYFKSISKFNIDTIKLCYTKRYELPSHSPPPFPILKKQ